MKEQEAEDLDLNEREAEDLKQTNGNGGDLKKPQSKATQLNQNRTALEPQEALIPCEMVPVP